MKSKYNLRIALFRLFQIGTICLTILGYLKGIFISLDIDESYVVAQSYRLAIGEHLFTDMWEPHQLSAFFNAVFIRLYLFVFQTTDYIIIYLRVVALFVHTWLGVWLFKILKGNFNTFFPFLLTLLHMNFFPKWMQTAEFELMHYWFLLALFLIMYPYFSAEKKQWWRPFLAGICIVGCMLCYPTMILLYPIYLLGFPILECLSKDAKGIRKYSSSLWLTLGALVSGGFFLIYLFSYQSPQDLLQNIQYIFMDESHTTYTMAEKMGMYAKQLKAIWEIYYECLLQSAIIVAFLLGILAIIIRIKKNISFHIAPKKIIDFALIGIFCLSALILEKNHICGCILEDQNQFYLQARYAAIIIPGIYIGIRYHKSMAAYFWLCIMPALASVPATLLVTNMNADIAFSKVMLGVYGSLLILEIFLQKEVAKQKALLQFILRCLEIGLLLGFFVCRLILIRVTGCLPVTIMAPIERMEYGPEKGIYILEEQAQIWNANYQILKEVISKDDRLLYIGAENLVYLATEGSICTPSTQGTTVFNEIFIEYYKVHPHKIPNIIVIDKTFESNPVYRLFSNTDIIMDWLTTNYPDTTELETAHLKILYVENTINHN